MRRGYDVALIKPYIILPGEAVPVAGAQRPLAADFAAPLAYYPEPGLLFRLMAMMRPQKYEQRSGLYMLEPYMVPWGYAPS